jgi:hypothetical protein
LEKLTRDPLVCVPIGYSRSEDVKLDFEADFKNSDCEGGFAPKAAGNWSNSGQQSIAVFPSILLRGQEKTGMS